MLINFEVNLQYVAGVEVDLDYPCRRNPSICGNDYCRCCRVEGAHFTREFDLLTFLDDLISSNQEYKKTNKTISPITKYCLER